MAENDFDKTVKMPAGGIKQEQSSDKTIQGLPAAKIEAGEDKTVKLAAPQATAAQPQQTPKPEIPAPISVIPPSHEGMKITRLHMITIFFALVLIAAGSIWYFMPGYIKNRAEKLTKESKYTQSAMLLKRALYLFPLHPDQVLIPLGKNLRLSKEFSEAQKHLEIALSRKPDSIEALSELGLTFVQLGQKQKAFDTFQKALSIAKDDQNILRWSAQIAYELKDLGSSSSSFEKLRSAGAATAEDLKDLGIVYFEMGKFAESEKALAESRNTNPKLKGLNTLMARTYSAEEKFEDAVKLYKDELALSPDNPDLAENFAGACIKASDDFAAKNKPEDSLKYLENGLTVSSKQSPSIHYKIAAIYAKQKKSKEALNHLGLAITATPEFKTMAAKDPSFTPIRKLPNFKKLVK